MSRYDNEFGYSCRVVDLIDYMQVREIRISQNSHFNPALFPGY